MQTLSSFLTLALALVSTLALVPSGCDTAVVQACSVTVVGVELDAPDMDMDGKPDHAGWVAGRMSGACSDAKVKALQVAAYKVTDGGFTYYGAGKPLSVNLQTGCVVWTWPAALPIQDHDWAVVTTPIGGGTAGMVYSGNVGANGAILPVWSIGGDWATFLPYGIPSKCDPF